MDIGAARISYIYSQKGCETMMENKKRKHDDSDGGGIPAPEIRLGRDDIPDVTLTDDDLTGLADDLGRSL